MKTAITSLMALMVSLTITLAGTKGNGFGNGGMPHGQVTQNGTQVAHYTATYSDYFFGSVTCTGVHQTGKNFGQHGEDSFTCTATPAGALLTNVIPNETLTLGNIGGWLSDYYGLTGGSVYATAFNAVVSSDGKSYTAVANY
jgi:Na+-driven multidrug efflux pump